jgi:hypothetical protein
MTLLNHRAVECLRIIRAKCLCERLDRTHVQSRKLLQIWKQLVVIRLLSSRYQDVFALLVPSCCDKCGTSCYHLVTRSMTVTDLLQVVPTRPIHRLLRACYHQLVNNMLRADDIRLVGTTCCKSIGLINLVTRWQHLIPDLYHRIWAGENVDSRTSFFFYISCSTLLALKHNILI